MSRPHALRLTALFIALTSLLLSACGGGDSDSSPQETPVTPTNVPDVTRVTASQTDASNLILVANDNVDEVAAAAAAGSQPGAPASTDMANAQSVSSGVAQPSLAQTINCSTLGGGVGSGTYGYDYKYGTDTRNFESKITYNNCSYTISGTTYTFNGYSTSKIVYASSTSSDFTSEQAYDMTYSYAGAYNYSGSYKGNQSCTYTAGTFNCAYNAADSDASVSGTSGVTVDGSQTKITRGTVKTKRTVPANSLTITYSNWTYDSATGRATGTATVVDSLGNKATIVGVANGSTVTYTVTIVYNGSTTVYTVTV
jgi:hypothetical protein